MIDPRAATRQPRPRQAIRRRRGATPSTLVDEALAADAARRSAIAEFETLRAEQNAFGKTVAPGAEGREEGPRRRRRRARRRVKAASAAAAEAEAELHHASCGTIANSIIDGVPAGGEDDFVTLRDASARSPPSTSSRATTSRLGETARRHRHGAAAPRSPAPASTSSRGIGARLELALMNMALDHALAAGFIPLITPDAGAPGDHGTAPASSASTPTRSTTCPPTTSTSPAPARSRSPATTADEILDLDRRARSATPAGPPATAARPARRGKDTRGIIRVHQFNKLEMFTYVLPGERRGRARSAWSPCRRRCCRPSACSYRVIDIAAGDLGSSAARKYDIEAWVPTQGAYRELTCTSQLHHATRPAASTSATAPSRGKTAPVATLNGTLATTRWIVAILETHQQADGSVRRARGAAPVPRRPRGARADGQTSGVTRRRRHRDRAGSSPSTSTAPSLHEDGTITDAVRRRRSAGCARLGHEVMLADRAQRGPTTLPVLDRLGHHARVRRLLQRRDHPAPRRRTRPIGYARDYVETFDPTDVLQRHPRAPRRRAAYAVEDEHGFYRYTEAFPDGTLGIAQRARRRSRSCSATQATRVVVISPDHDIEEFLAVVEQMGLHQVSYAIGWTAWLDIAPDGVNKATALERVRELARHPAQPGDRRRRRPQRHRHAALGRRGGSRRRHGPGARRGARTPRSELTGDASRRRPRRGARAASRARAEPSAVQGLPDARVRLQHSVIGSSAQFELDHALAGRAARTREGCPSGRWSQS